MSDPGNDTRWRLIVYGGAGAGALVAVALFPEDAWLLPVGLLYVIIGLTRPDLLLLAGGAGVVGGGGGGPPPGGFFGL